jgi:hypothetical protein
LVRLRLRKIFILVGYDTKIISLIYEILNLKMKISGIIGEGKQTLNLLLTSQQEPLCEKIAAVPTELSEQATDSITTTTRGENESEWSLHESHFERSLVSQCTVF